jgi:large subunit ribosomal protein L6
MSTRIAKKPLPLPSGVQAEQSGNKVTIKGPKGSITVDIHPVVNFSLTDNVIQLDPANMALQGNIAMTGTMRALLGCAVTGVTQGFMKKLLLVGVGYRAAVQGSKLNLTLGFSHPVAYDIPQGITISTPTQTEIVIEGIDKQKVGQVASEVRAYRPPEPYKGKGVRYSDEKVILKETKKK